MKRQRWICRVVRAATLVGGSALLPASACNGQLGQQFRVAAGDSIEQGVQSIVAGVLDGVFAIVAPDSTSTS